MKKLFLVSILCGCVSSAFAKTVVTCQNVGDDAGLESVSIIENSNQKLQAKVVVSGPGDFMETYTYAIKARPAPPRRLGAPLAFATADGKRFVLSICSTCTPVDKKGSQHGEMSLIGPKNAQLYPGEALAYSSLACTFGNR